MPEELTDVFSVIREAESYLVERGVPNARRNAEWILSHVLKCRAPELYLTTDRSLEPSQLDAFDALLHRRGSREPLQYVLGSTEFMSLPFYSTRGVFIPRPDTEVLVEKVEELLTDKPERRAGNRHLRGSSDRILDLCCGTGAIGIALACRLPHVSCVAVDVDEAAVELTRRNAKLNGVRGRVRCVKADALEFLRRETDLYDTVVCNPPYVRTGDIKRLPPEIRDHEPSLSLDGGADGLDFYRRVTPALRDAVRPDGVIAFEIGDTLGEKVAHALNAASFCDITIQRDNNGLERVVTAVRP
jgi:release factor glutamine methyltransferase